MTMTSTWCPIRDTQVPILISIIMNKTKESYKIHWDFYFSIYGQLCPTIEVFLDRFPGNTSDFSDAIRKGFFIALYEYCMKKYGKVLLKESKKLLYRYCEVHFKRNLTRIARISKVINLDRKHYFKSQELALLIITDLSHFVNKVRKLLKEFILAAS